MSVINKLASALIRRDEIPNQELAAIIANSNNKIAIQAIQELVENPDHKNKAIQSDCKGSVITNDHCVGILIKLAAIPAYSEDAFSLLLEH